MIHNYPDIGVDTLPQMMKVIVKLSTSWLTSWSERLLQDWWRRSLYCLPLILRHWPAPIILCCLCSKGFGRIPPITLLPGLTPRTQAALSNQLYCQVPTTALVPTTTTPLSFICATHSLSAIQEPTFNLGKYEACLFLLRQTWLSLINLTCWQYGCDSMLRVGRGQGWLPNATLSGKLRGRGGGGDTIQIFPPPSPSSDLRGESRKGSRGGRWESSQISKHFWPPGPQLSI